MESWWQLFPNASLHNLMAHMSDHMTIILQCEVTSNFMFQNRFHFENSWLCQPDIHDVVNQSWVSIEDVNLLSKIQSCTIDLGRGLQDSHDTTTFLEAHYLKEELGSLLMKEECYWQ